MKSFYNSILDRLEKQVIQCIERDSRSIGDRWQKASLHILSKCFQSIVNVRAYFYDRGWKKSKKAVLPVVCIGNITAGGTGKTPFVNLLIQDLKSLTKLAVISTGYKAQGVSKYDVITPLDQYGRFVQATYCGDEPYLLKKQHPDVHVFVSKNRFLALDIAKKNELQIALLDDGFQMKSLKKELSIILMSADNLFGYDYYLPRGYLRESPTRLKEVQFICITQVQGHCFDKLCEQLAPYTSAKIMGAQMVPQRIVGDRNWALDQIKGKKIGVFCGLGNPVAYIRSLEQLGTEIVATLVLNDHATPTLKQWELFNEQCRQKQAELLVCTAKDFCKIQDVKRELPISYLESELTIVHGHNHYRTLKQKILQLAKQKRIKT